MFMFRLLLLILLRINFNWHFVTIHIKQHRNQQYTWKCKNILFFLVQSIGLWFSMYHGQVTRPLEEENRMCRIIVIQMKRCSTRIQTASGRRQWCHFTNRLSFDTIEKTCCVAFCIVYSCSDIPSTVSWSTYRSMSYRFLPKITRGRNT